MFSRRNFEKNKRAIFWLVLPLFVLIALRGETVGADTLSYNKMYECMHAGSFGLQTSYERIEIGYKVLLYILTRISGNPQLQHIILAVFFEIVFVRFLYKNSENPAGYTVLFMGLGLYAFYFTGVRQSIAMTICLLAYEKVKKKQFFRFVIVVLIASLFHKSAIFFLLAYFVANIRPKKSYIPLYLIGFAAIAIFNERLFKISGEIFDVAYGIEKTDNGRFMFFIVAIITVLSFLYIGSLVKHNNNATRLIQLNVITMAMWILRLFSRTAERPSMYFMPFTFLLVGQLIETIDDMQTKQIVKIFSTLFLGVYFIYRLNGAGLIPYTFCWQ